MPTNSFSGDQRRRVAWRSQAGATTLRVPLWTASEKGEMREGLIRVPTRLAHAQPDTNEKHEFDQIVRDSLKRWAEWLEKRGWKMSSRPQVRGPFDPPTRTEKDEPNPDEKWYFAYARFTRTEPMYISLEDFLHERDRAQRHGVNLEADRASWAVVEEEDSGWVDPLQYAEERRRKLGVKRENYLLGPLSEPRALSMLERHIGRNPGGVRML